MFSKISTTSKEWRIDIDYEKMKDDAYSSPTELSFYVNNTDLGSLNFPGNIPHVTLEYRLYPSGSDEKYAPYLRLAGTGIYFDFFDMFEKVPVGAEVAIRNKNRKIPIENAVMSTKPEKIYFDLDSAQENHWNLRYGGSGPTCLKYSMDADLESNGTERITITEALVPNSLKRNGNINSGCKLEFKCENSNSRGRAEHFPIFHILQS